MKRNGRTGSGALPGSVKRITQDRKAMQKLMVFGGILIISLVVIFQFIVSRPPLSDECSHIGLMTLIRGGMPQVLGGDGDPLGTTKVLWKCAEEYREEHPGSVLGIYIVCYIALQAFAIPGPLLLSILAGAMYPVLFAQLLILVCSTTGSVLAYLLSQTLGEELVHWCWPNMIERFRKTVQENKDNLFYYMLFLRLTPIMPNWFVNIACPLVGVPLSCFVGATALGLLPANYFHVTTGSTLSTMTSLSFWDNKWALLTLLCLQFLALAPAIFKSKISQKAKKFVK